MPNQSEDKPQPKKPRRKRVRKVAPVAGDTTAPDDAFDSAYLDAGLSKQSDVAAAPKRKARPRRAKKPAVDKNLPEIVSEAPSTEEKDKDAILEAARVEAELIQKTSDKISSDEAKLSEHLEDGGLPIGADAQNPEAFAEFNPEPDKERVPAKQAKSGFGPKQPSESRDVQDGPSGARKVVPDDRSKALPQKSFGATDEDDTPDEDGESEPVDSPNATKTDEAALRPPINTADEDFKPAAVLDAPEPPVCLAEALASPVPLSVSASPRGDASTRPSMASLFAQQGESAGRPVRVYLAAIVGIGIFAASLMLWSAMSRLHLAVMPAAPHDLANQVPKPDQREGWLRDLRAMHATGQGTELAGIPTVQAQASELAAPRTRRLGPPAAGGRRRTDHVRPSDVDPAFAAYFGSGQKFHSANSHQLTANAERGSAAASEGLDVRGKVLSARLQDDISSDPVGSPVVATLVRPVTLQGVRLSSGSEVHGTVSGHSDTRIFVSFQFLRTEAGEIYNLVGAARDIRGRAGIPGVKRFTGRTAASIGVSSAARMVQQVGRELAGSVGSVLGAGIETGASETADKSKRVDQDEYVVTTQAGASFGIYLQQMKQGRDTH